MSKYGFLIACILTICTQANINVITNGDFQLPILPAASQSTSCPQNWNCSQTTLLSPSALAPTQSIKLSLTSQSWLSQIVSFQQFGLYHIIVQHTCPTCGIGVTANVDITWDDIPMFSITAASTSQIFNTTIQIQISPIQVKFELTDFGVDVIIDNLILELTTQTPLIPPIPPTPPTPPPLIPTISLPTLQISSSSSLSLPSTLLDFIAMFLSIPLSTSIKASHGLSLALADLWIYSYTKKNYTGIIRDVFDAVQQIQGLKLNITCKLTSVDLSAIALPISNYSPFTDEKFKEKENSSAVFIESNLPFLVFQIPKTIILCVIFYTVFKLTKGCKQINEFFQQYKFLKTMIVFTILQQNIAYFVFVCCEHLSLAFGRKLMDRIFYVFTIFVMYTCVLFSFCFYLGLGRFKSCWTKLYNSGVVKNFRGHVLLTIKNTTRSFVRGFVLFFFRNLYVQQMITLTIIELLSLVLTILTNNIKTRPIFETKTSYCLCLIYHILFIFLHITFIFDQTTEMQSDQFPEIYANILTGQEIVAYLIGVITIIGFVIDLLPSSFFITEPPIQDEKTKKNVKQISGAQNQDLLCQKPNEAQNCQNKRKFCEEKQQKQKQASDIKLMQKQEDKIQQNQKQNKKDKKKVEKTNHVTKSSNFFPCDEYEIQEFDKQFKLTSMKNNMENKQKNNEEDVRKYIEQKMKMYDEKIKNKKSATFDERNANEERRINNAAVKKKKEILIKRAKN